jgi:hypothetical protein
MGKSLKDLSMKKPRSSTGVFEKPESAKETHARFNKGL